MECGFSFAYFLLFFREVSKILPLGHEKNVPLNHGRLSRDEKHHHLDRQRQK